MKYIEICLYTYVSCKMINDMNKLVSCDVECNSWIHRFMTGTDSTTIQHHHINDVALIL